MSHKRTHANVVAIRRPDEVLFGMRTGLFGHPTTTTFRVADEEIVGAVEDTKALGDIVTKLGLLTLGQLLNYNLAWGPEGLAKALARWAAIDLEAIQRAAEEEAAAEDEAAQEGIAGAEAAMLEAETEEGPETPAGEPVL